MLIQFILREINLQNKMEQAVVLNTKLSETFEGIYRFSVKLKNKGNLRKYQKFGFLKISI